MAPTMTTTSVIKDTALALRRALEPDDDPTRLSDSQYLHTNRGNKLKRGAADVGEGHLAGRRPYKKQIIHNGYTRSIIHTNPRRYDAEGYELASSDEDTEADADAAERNPYSGVDVLEQLMPLSRPYDLENHPAMSLIYKIKILDNMVMETGDTLQAERHKLVEIKTRMTELRGDYNWIPCGAIKTIAPRRPMNGTNADDHDAGIDILSINLQPEDVDKIQIVNGKIVLKRDDAVEEATALKIVKSETAEPETTSLPAAPQSIHRVLPLPDPPSTPPLPVAEETKRLLAAVVQKQSEIVQGVSQLYNNLLRAKRMKETVWRWCRAEGHVDEMSDGEDWVDLEQWGLTQPLTKGAEEGVGMGNGGDDPDYLANRKTEGGGTRGRRRGAQ